MLNKTQKSEFGKCGEKIAANYLLNKGYKVIGQNHLIKSDEIDIIAKQGDGTLVFCEVKTLRGPIDPLHMLTPEDNLTALKYKKLARAAQIFAAKHPHLINEERGWRIDLVAIVLDEKENLLRLRHYQNI